MKDFEGSKIKSIGSWQWIWYCPRWFDQKKEGMNGEMTDTEFLFLLFLDFVFSLIQWTVDEVWKVTERWDVSYLGLEEQVRMFETVDDTRRERRVSIRGRCTWNDKGIIRFEQRWIPGNVYKKKVGRREMNKEM